MSGERVAEGILGAFFGSFVGAPLGQQAAGLVTNLLASGIYEVCGGVARDLKTKGNHNIQKLAAASLRSAVEAGKRECGAAWGPAAVMRLDELQREAEETLVAMETEPSRQLVEALLVGRPEGMEEVIGRLIEDYVQGQCHDFRQVKADLAPRFFLHFREKYVSDEFAEGRHALERDIAWATLQQGQEIKALVLSLGAGLGQKFVAFQGQLDRIEQGVEGAGTTSLSFARIEDHFREILDRLTRMETKQDLGLAKQDETLEIVKQMRDALAVSPEEIQRLKGLEGESEAMRAALAESEARAAALAAQVPAGAGLEAEALRATANGDYREAERLYALIDEEKTREAARIRQQRGDNAFRAHHLIDAARFYEEAYALEPTDERNDRCGNLLAMLGHKRQAIPYLDRRVNRLINQRELLEPKGQWNPGYRNGLAAAYMNRGVAKQGLPDLPGAIEDYGLSINLREELRTLVEPQGRWTPTYRNDLAGAYTNRGNAKQGLPDLPGALEDYGNAIEIREALRDELELLGQWHPEYRNDLAGAYVNRGNVKQILPDLSGAVEDCGVGITLMEELRRLLEPQGNWHPEFRNDLAKAYLNRGNAKPGLPDLPGAGEDYVVAITLLEDLRKALEPDGQWSPEYRGNLAKAYVNRGNIKHLSPDLPGAMADYGIAINVLEDLCKLLEPEGQWNPEYRNDLAKAYMNRGNVKQFLPDLPGAMADYGIAITGLEDLRKLLEPEGQWNPEYRNDLAGVYMNRGIVREGLSDLNGSVADYGDAIEIMEGLRDDLEPKGQWNSAYRNDLARAYMNRGNAKQGLPDFPGAVADYGNAIRIREGIRDDLEPLGQWNPEYRNGLALAYAQFAEALATSNPHQSVVESSQAIGLYESLASEDPISTWPGFVRACYRFALITRINAYLALKEYDLAAADERRAREIPD